MIAPLRPGLSSAQSSGASLLVLAIMVGVLAPTMTASAQAVAEPPVVEDQTATGLKTVAVATLSGYDRLMTDIDFLGELGGRPASAQMLEGMIAFFTQGKGLEGLDKSRPMGVVLQTDGLQFVPVACLPIADINPILELAEGFGIEPIGLGEDIYEIEMEEQTLFIKQMGEWTFAAQSSEALDSAPEDPAGMLSALVQEYDLGVQVMAQNVPEMYRGIAIEQMRQGMQEGLERQDDETDEQFEFRKDLAESQIEQLQDLITGLDGLKIGWAIDSEAKNTYMDVEITGLPGSDLALASSGYEENATRTAGFHRPEAAMTMRASGETPAELLEKQRSQLEATVEMLRVQAKQGIDEADEIPAENRDAVLGAVNDLLDAYEGMLLSGRVDMAMSMNLEGDTYDMIGAALVTDPSKIEEAFKKLAKLGEDKPDFPGVEWNADSHAGVTLHRMSVPVPDQADRARDVLGDTLELTMGVSTDFVYFAAGPDSVASLKQAIDTSSARGSEAASPAEMSVSVSQVLNAILPALDGQARAIVQMLTESLEEQPEQNDRVRMTVDYIENGSRNRLLIEEGVLRAAGAAAAAAAAQQAGGGGF